MTNGYPIFKWAPGVPILNNYEDENENFDTMEKVAYDVRLHPDDEDDKDDEDDEDSGKDDKSDSCNSRYDNENPYEIRGKP